MEYINRTSNFKCEKSAVTLGKFDGVHIGHQKLIREVIKKKEAGLKSVVFTFDIHPLTFLEDNGTEQQIVKNLLTNEERKQRLFEMGVTTVVEYPVNKEMLEMEAEEFVHRVLCDKLDAKFIVVGRDFHFGYKRRGNVDLLQELADKGLFEVKIVDKELIDGEIVSSTRIRELLHKGNIEKVNELLGYEYQIENKVVEGNRLGRTWGIPTINMEVDDHKLLPPNGVYFSVIEIDQNRYYGITNIGNKPTVGKGYKTGLETYLYSYNGNLYGKNARVSLMHFHRPEQRFENFEKLVEQLHRDIACGKKYFQIDL